LSSDTISADASARVGSPALTSGLRPFGVLEDAIDYSGPTTLKYDATGGQNGNFGAIGLDGTGASIYQDTIEDGSDTPVCAQGQPGCTDPTVPTETGNMTGPTRKGINYLLAHTSPACDEFHEVFVSDDTTPNPNDYAITDRCNLYRPGGPDDSLSIIVTPVIDSLCHGHCDVTILRFALFLVEDLGECKGNSCEVHGRWAKANVDVGALIGAYDEDSSLSFVRLVE
jgi:hypothetical protein